MKRSSDERWMLHAVRLAKRGFPAPNPHVGCVLVQDDAVVGEGWHAYAGGDHAEAMALKQAGDRAKGATAYVTLEPCNHHGRTPPCSQSLIQSQVKRVVIACLDPNPKAQGGAQSLVQAGIEIETGVCLSEATQVNEQFLSAQAMKRPYVVVKAALTLDGRIALPNGESQWITGELARKAAHRLRAECGAVLVGRKTVQIDNPRLTARLRGVVNQPVRIVLDPHHRLSGQEAVFGPEAKTIHVTGEINLRQMLASLWSQGIMGILVEGGSHTITRFIEEKLVDRYELFVAPKLLGSGPTWLADLSLQSLNESPKLDISKVQKVGPDLWITAKPLKQ